MSYEEIPPKPSGVINRILYELMGPSKKEIWMLLSQQIGANYCEENDGFFEKDRVELCHRNWIVTLDVHTVSTGKSTTKFTRIRAPYLKKDGFRFTIYRRSFLSDVGKFFGMEDVALGYDDDEQFDLDFIIKGNDHYKLWKLFENPYIRELLQSRPEIKLNVKAAEYGWFGQTYKDDVNMVEFIIMGVVKDINLLKTLFELFIEILDQLHEIGSIYEDNPLFNEGV